MGVVLVGFALLLAGPAFAASIGIFSDTTCTDCNLTIPQSGVATFYVSAVNAATLPGFCEGLGAAEFRILGLPTSWAAVALPSSSALLHLGNPLDEHGAAISFYPGQQTGECILLYTVEIQSGDSDVEVELGVGPRSPWPCPLLTTDCFEPISNCVSTGVLFVNSDRTCNVQVNGLSWAGIKGLYK